jgi:hypothetical protein
VIDLLLKRGSDRYERVPASLVGLEIVPARADPRASLALPAPVGMFLCFAHTRHQLAAADRERVAAAICSETAQQFVRSAVAQIKSFFGAPSVNPFIWKERQSLDHFRNAMNPRGIKVHGRRFYGLRKCSMPPDGHPELTQAGLSVATFG